MTKSKQVEYSISKGYAVGLEWTDDPHPRNCYWELWGLPLFEIPDSATVMYELSECRKALKCLHQIKLFQQC
jgi:ribulose-bisphosphate carboxylase small chain